MYKITYFDNSTFKGGIPEDSKWNLINKPIKSLYYELYGKKIYLEGFTEYNHIVSFASFLDQSVKLFKIELLVRHPNICYVFRWNLITKKFDIATGGLEEYKKNTGSKLGVYQISPFYKLL